MWTNYFDKIYLINLAKRPDRLEQATAQLNKYGIPFERFEAVENLNGAEGLKETMEIIFQNAVHYHHKNILVFEDDIDIIEPEINEVMTEVVRFVPPNYDMIFLGGQLCQTPSQWFNQHLLKVQTVYATHAVMYSLQAIKKILSRNFYSPIDNCIVQSVQPEGQCYAVYPILASQIVSKSDIYSDRESMDWKKWLEVKYWDQIEAMKVNGHFHPNAKIYARQS